MPEPDRLPELVDSSESSIDRAVEVLKAGGLVALPTETVYGLGADALSPEAVKRVFRAKGRPADHPLIVHLGDSSWLDGWAADVPPEARILAEAFWPGPLTIVLPRQPSVPLEVTGGRETVAVRVPSHPVTRRVLGAFGSGVAAPSANRFGRVSPTTAADVVAELGEEVDLVLDGGPCEVGVESTVVEFVPRSQDAGKADEANAVTVLRLGGVSAEAIEDVLGHRVSRTPSGPARAPGMLASHYAPQTPLFVCDPDEAPARVADLAGSGRRVGVLSLEKLGVRGASFERDAGGDLALLARSLYGWLREADAESLDALVAVPPESRGLGAAVRDRLMRAAQR
jgi:L-threonylcarbamoyladenylate synthase